MKVNYKVIHLLVIVFTFFSCGEKGESASSNDKHTEDNTQLANQKLNLLVDVFNSFSTSRYASFGKYAQSFGENPEKFEKHRDWYNGEQVNELVSKKITDLSKATDIDVHPELDPLILSYQEKAKKLIKVLNASYSYYDMKDYESDVFAKAKEYHKPTVNTYNHFFNADTALRNLSDSIQNVMELAHLRQLKEEGQTLDYLIGMALNTSEKMLNVSQSAKYSELNTNDLISAQQDVRKVFDELTQFKSDKPDEFNANHNMSLYYNSLRDFTKSSKELCNRKKENRPFSTGEKMNLNPSSGWMVKGSTYHVLRTYNDLVNRYNSMIN